MNFQQNHTYNPTPTSHPTPISTVCPFGTVYNVNRQICMIHDLRVTNDHSKLKISRVHYDVKTQFGTPSVDFSGKEGSPFLPSSFSSFLSFPSVLLHSLSHLSSLLLLSLPPPFPFSHLLNKGIQF